MSRHTLLQLALLSALLTGASFAQEDEQPGLRGLSGLSGLSEGPLDDLTDAGSAGQAFIEVELARDTFLLGEPFEVRLRFGIEEDFRRNSLVQLFQQALDIPLQLHAPWVERPEGLRRLEDSAAASATDATFVVEESIAHAKRLGTLQRDGRTYTLYEFAPRFVGTRPGVVQLSAPVLRYAHTTRFEDDFIAGRRPVDRHEALVRASPTRITILPPPEEGRPRDFSGAIGRFRIEVEAPASTVTQGLGFALTLRIEALDPGSDLSTCRPPTLANLEGFHVRGILQDLGQSALSVRYDLVAQSTQVSAIPPVRFTYFDTTPPAGYRSVESAPLPILVLPATHLPQAEAPSEEPSGQADPPLVLAALVLGLLGALLGLVVWIRTRSD